MESNRDIVQDYPEFWNDIEKIISECRLGKMTKEEFERAAIDAMRSAVTMGVWTEGEAHEAYHETMKRFDNKDKEET